MTEQRLHDVLAAAFVAEGVDAHFALLGDANMHWATVMAEKHGVRTVHARHEHCAAAMATAYAYVTGRVGIASVTHGPGFTQTMTALATAARGEIPLIIFAGEVPTTAVWTLQYIDQAPFARACGAEYIQIQSTAHALDRVREAFCIARFERRPVVLGVPSNLQRAAFPNPPAYVPSSDIIPAHRIAMPDATAVESVAGMIASARRPIILAGRGVVEAGARNDVLDLAKHGGALLATTLAARGLFDGEDYAIGIAGGWSTDLASGLFEEADLVVAIGASLTGHTTHTGKLYPKARVVQIDTHPRALRHQRKVADFHIAADAKAAAVAISHALAKTRRDGEGYRNAELRERIKNFREVSDAVIAPGTIDPRLAVQEINRVVPKDWFVVGGSGHCAYFAGTNLQGRSPALFASIRDFGAIGSNLAHAIGIAVARSDNRILLIDGDGSLMMHIQELETIARQGFKMLIIALNDGAYGSEVHKLVADGFSDREVQFGRPDFASMARGFGLRGHTVTDLSQMNALFDEHLKQDRAEVWDIPIAGNVLSTQFKREGIEKKH